MSLRKTLMFLLAVVITTASFASAPLAHAEYSREYVIDDSVFLDSQVMSASDINNFLISKSSWLANYTIPEYISVPYPLSTGGLGYASARQYNDITNEALYNKTVSQLIYDEATAHSVNPRLILSVLQKESSAITKSAPSSNTTAAWPLFYMYNESMEGCLKYGSSCNDSSFNSISINYGGIGQQIAYATAWYSVRFGQYNASKNFTVSVDGTTFTCQNASTRILYIYTPHVSSWQNFYNIWTTWWEDPTFGPPAPNQPFAMAALKSLPYGSWNIWNSTKFVSGNFDGNGGGDIAAMYNYGSESMAIFLFGSSLSFNPQQVLMLPKGSWSVANCSNLVKGNFDKIDNLDDLAVLYNYGNESIGLWVFESSNSFKPKLYKYLPPKSWNISATSDVVAGNFDGAEGDDIAALYNYGSSGIGLWNFSSSDSYSPQLRYTSGPNSINFSQTKGLVSANLDNNGTSDLAVLYDYGSAKMSLISFESTNGYKPNLLHATGAGAWSVPNSSNLVAIDLDGGDSLSDLALVYDYAQEAVGIFVFNSTLGYSPISRYWSGRKNFSLAYTNRRIISEDFNNDNRDDIATFYTYGRDSMAIFSFNRTAEN